MPQAHFVTAPTQATLEEDQSIPSVLQATSACASDLNAISTSPNQQIAQETAPSPDPEPNSPTETTPSEIPGIQPLETEQRSEEFANLQNQLNTLQALLDKELAAIDQVKNYINGSNNQDFNNQDLNVDTTSNFSFSQGIYDFAISYHFGDSVSDRLPK